MLLSFAPVAVAGPPPGYVDATIFGYDPLDATAALQAAINTGFNVWVPNVGTDWIVEPIFLTQSNQTILFEEGVVVAAKEGSFLGTHDYLFSNTTRANVRLEGYGATFRMRQQDYLAAPYPPSEFRFGISSLGTNGFEIVGLTIENTGGDGIYLGDAGGSTYSQNILIKDVTINNAFRNGISLISAANVTIENTVFVNTSGNFPSAGIDLEPNGDQYRMENIVIRDSVFLGNFREGIIWSLVDGEDPGNPPITGLVENITVLGNGRHGLAMSEGAIPGVTIKDSLIVENFADGFNVGFDCTISIPACAVTHDIEYSAFWDNAGSAISGNAVLGTGSITNQEPSFVKSFVSTDLNDPYFMYLEPSTSTAITQGASDGSYMGARPVLYSGDMDGDGLVTSDDAPLLIQALTDRAGYDLNGFTTPGGDIIDANINGDVNRNGIFDLGDVNALSAMLGGPASAGAVPEPSVAVLFGIAVSVMALSRRLT